MSRLGFFVSEAWEIQSRDRAHGMASLTSLTAVLFLLAVVLLAGINIRGLAHTLEGKKGLTVFLADDIGSNRLAELEGIFRGFDEVADVRFVSQQEALRAMEAELGGVDIEEALPSNPLSPCFEISLKPAAAGRTGAVQQLALEIGEYDGVDEVVYGGDWIQSLERGLRTIYLATAGAGILAALAVLLVLWNTLKLAFLARRETVRILKVMGATTAFIRTPYLVLGALHAGTSSLLALALAFALHRAIAEMLPGVRFFSLSAIATFFFGALLLGILSSLASVEPALRDVERRTEAVTR